MAAHTRSPEEQAHHDRVLADIATSYLYYDRLVFTNPGAARAVSVGRAYPDLVIKERVPPPEARREPRILAIGEVETVSSAQGTEVVQWRSYSRLGPPFLLFVPQESVTAAQQLLGEHRISVAELWGYSYQEGRIRLTQIEVPLRPTEAAVLPVPSSAGLF